MIQVSVIGTLLRSLAILLCFSAGLRAQGTAGEISVPFTDGFLGVVGNNTQDATDTRTLTTLGIQKAFFIQRSTNGQFQLSGNDIPATLRLQLVNGTVLNISGEIIWRATIQGKVMLFGFIADPTVSLNLSAYGGPDYQITGGADAGATNFGMNKIGSTLKITDGGNISGNAATAGLLEALNQYLNDTRSLSPVGPVTSNALVTCDSTPLINGIAVLAAGESMFVQVNGKTYTSPDQVILLNGNWSLRIPPSDALSAGTFPVSAFITNSTGYVLGDATTDELTVLAVCDSDGDGVTDPNEISDGTNPADPCQYRTASRTVDPSQAWNNADCDGDGVTNAGETADGTSLLDPCDRLATSQTLTPSQGWNIVDCDGDGVTNGAEIMDGTDPTDACDFVLVSQTIMTSQPWKDSDCDGDGDKNVTDPAPKDPCTHSAGSIPDPANPVWRIADCDGDGVTNGKEKKEDGTNPSDPCDYLTASQTMTPTSTWTTADCDGDGDQNGTDPDPKDPCTYTAGSIPVTADPIWRKGDCDGDGVSNGKENQDGTDPSDQCDYISASQTMPTSTAWKDADCDGDGVSNKKELEGGTGPADPCSYSSASQTLPPSTAWKNGDCDGDGDANGTDNNPLEPCTFTAGSLPVTTNKVWRPADCDGDGTSNGKEADLGTDPLDPCDFSEGSQTGPTSQVWKNADCDGDGLRNELDQNVLVAVAQDDRVQTTEGTTVDVDIISNDDFSAAGGILITRTGGSAAGEFAFDNGKGRLTYRGLPGETGIVTIVYRVCNINRTPQVCAEATVTIDIDGSNVLIPDAFSPNGNGKNDKWIIRGLSEYPENKVTIFSRWGNKVYEASPYNNDWDGISNNELKTGGSRLPAGSYFYVLELGNGEKYSGFVYLAY